MESYVLESNLIFVVAVEQDICKGVLGFEVLEDVMHIRYLYVEEPFRKRGIATQMVKWTGNYAREKKMQGIVWTVAIAQEMKARVSRFFVRTGFHIPACEETTVTVQLESMEKSYLANLPLNVDAIENHLHHMAQLPLILKADYERRIKPTVRTACHLSEVRGRMIPELSIALERNGKIVSYVLFSDLQGELYLNAVYVNTQNATDLIKLLKYCLEIVKQKFCQYKTMKVTLINQEGNHLIDTLIKGAVTKSEIVMITFKTL